MLRDLGVENSNFMAKSSEVQSLDMGVSEKGGRTLFWGPYNKNLTIWGTIFGSPIFGNSHLFWGLGNKRKFVGAQVLSVVHMVSITGCFFFSGGGFRV